MLAVEANRGGSNASHLTAKADGIPQNSRARILRLPGRLGRLAWLPPFREPCLNQTRSTIHREAGGSPRLAAGQKTRLEGRQLSAGSRLPAHRGAGALLERGARRWEEIPAAMVDWDATAKAAVADQAEEDALAKKLHAQEQAQRIETVMDVDASLQVAPGVFLPPGEGMFLIDGKSVKP